MRVCAVPWKARRDVGSPGSWSHSGFELPVRFWELESSAGTVCTLTAEPSLQPSEGVKSTTA